MNANAALTALAIIRDTLCLPSMASASDIAAKVRETKAAADLAGAAVEAKTRRAFKPRRPMDLGPVDG